jgi:Flp pilus assembly protein TadD
MAGIPGAVLAKDAPTQTYIESAHSGLATSFREQAILLARQGLYAESEAYARQALGLQPDDVDTLNELGAALWWQRRPVEAEAIYRQADRLQPKDVRILTNLGLALYQQGRVDEAGDFYRRAIEIDIAAFDARVNLGIVLSDQGKFDEANDCLKGAREQRPDSAEASQNLGMNLGRMGKSHEAIQYYEEALRHRPDHPEMHRNLSYALLTCGDYERGWREYEWRLKCDPHPGYRINQVLWNGGDLAGRTILLHVEQGLGDTLQFIRFASMVKRRGGHVLVVCQAPLLQLVARCDGVDLAFDGSSYQPKCHVQAPLLSLPAIFGTTLRSLPAQVPYLATDPILVEHWRSEISRAIATDGDGRAAALDQTEPGRRPRPFLIGIAWQGNPGHSDDRWRSFRLAHFAPLAKLPGVRLISLQTNHGLDQLEAAGGPLRIVELPRRRGRDFMETAAIMTHLDLIITPDTAVAHLAGGLGRRVWIGLSTAVGEWRWLAGREDSPWYPTARLFHQTTLGDWDGVFRRMATELKQELEGITADA